MSNGKDPTFFTVISANGLKDDGEFGTFVSVSMGNQTLFRTKSVTGESPQWNDSYPIPIPSPRSFSIAIHRETSQGDILLGEIKDIIPSSGPTELILPIEPLAGGHPIVATVSLKSLKDLFISGDNNHSERLVCLSNFVIKSLSDRHPDLPRSARLSVAIVMNDNTLYKTTPVKKEPSDSHWNCNGKVTLSCRMAYTVEIINETASEKRLGFTQLDRDVLENLQEKPVRQKMVPYANGNPWLEIFFNAKVLSHSISDTLSQVITTPGPLIGLSENDILDLQQIIWASLQPDQHHLGSTLDRCNDNDNSSLQTISGLSGEVLSEAIQLEVLGNQLLEHFESEGSLPCLDSAIVTFHNAVQLIPDGHPVQATYLGSLGMALFSRFVQLEKLADLNNAIMYFEKSASLCPSWFPDKKDYLRLLGITLQLRFENLGQISDLERATSAFENLVELTADDDSNKAEYFSQYDNALGHWLTMLGPLGEISDMGKIISTMEKAVQLIPTGQLQYKAGYLNNLGNSYKRQFERLGEISDLEKAISAKESALEHIPTGDPNKAGYLNNLGILCRERFERLGEISDLEKAISAKENAVEITPTSHPDRAMYLNNLGNSYQMQFDRLGEISDLEKAISVWKNASELTPAGHPNKPMYLSNLGGSYHRQFETLGEITDLERAISAQENAVEFTPTGHPNKPMYLNNLGSSYLKQFEMVGEIPALEKGISALEKAVELTPTGHPDKALYLNNLGGSYKRQFISLGEISVLEKAISILENAVELTLTGDPNKAMYISNLASSYREQFESLGEISVLEKAISACENAVQLTPNGHPNKPMYLNNLASSYQVQFDSLGEISGLDKAISAQEKAIQLTPAGHPNKAGYLTNLGIVYQMHFERLGEISDLEKAISAKENAVELTLPGDPNKAMCLNNLGSSYQTQFERLGDISILERAIDQFRQASQSSSSPPRFCFKGATSWAKCAVILGLSPIEAYGTALNILPHVAWIGLTIPHRYTLLSDIGSIVHDAAIAAIIFGNYEMALEWVEQGRSIVWGQLLQLRTPVDDLQLQAPKIATQLLSVSQALDRASTREVDIEAGLSAERIALNHHSLASQWDKLIQQVRLIPGFEEFLLPKTVSQLIPAAKLGPIIAFSIHRTICHALILNTTGQSVLHIPLPNFSYEKAQNMLVALRRLYKSRFARQVVFEHEIQTSLSTFEEILSDLWTNVVLPVLDGLALSVCTTGNLPHIWWCPTGPLAFLPLHAAGLYTTDEPGHKLSDFAISSYTPTITALLNTQHNSPSTTFKILAIAQQSNHGQSYLSNTNTEVENLRKCAGLINVEILKGEQVTIDKVVQGMSESRWVHLACHGTQNPSDPIRSAFILADGDLELSRITKMTLPHAEFAFLSACQTAAGDVKLQDEAVHLAAGMLMAGYKSVIATMWAIRDVDGPLVADDVYAEILRNGQPDSTRAAYALHHATQKLRRSGAPFIAWVPFIHLGR